MPNTITPNQFIDKWRNHQLNERAAYEHHFLDLCALVNPTWHQNAHRRPDQAVFAEYGWPDNLSDEKILARLFELNQERCA